MKKNNECAAKRKERFAKLCALVRFSLSPCSESSLLLSPRSVPAPVPALVPALMLTLVPAFVPAPVPTPLPVPFSCSRSLVVLSSGCVLALAAISY